MAYEYNPRSEPFNRVSNPHRVENVFLAVCAAAALIGALVLLIDDRAVYLTHNFVRFTREIVSAVGLLTLALTYGIKAIGQLRFFFGRGQPADLVPSLRADEYGYRAADGSDRQIPDAAVLRQTLQQNAITYRVPPGPIDNLLYYLVHDLVTSPQLTQTRVREQFRNGLAIVFLLVLFAISLIGVHNPAALGWIGCFYFVLANAIVLRPLAASGRSIDGTLFERIILGLVVVAVVGPVIAASVIPAHSFALQTVIDFIPATFVVLVMALAVSALVFFAGTANTVKPREFAIAPHLETPSVNASPSQLYTELARELQRLWVDGIPNRSYMRIVPDVSGRQGTFRADVIEELQPQPLDIERMTFERALRLPTTRLLVVADVLCTLMTCAGAALIVLGAQLRGQAYTELTIGAGLVIVARFGIDSASAFWRRFDFLSKIYWIDWNGTYTRAATRIGALMNDRVQSERDVISIESMTLRVWVAELDTVAFSADEERNIVAIRGLPDEAARLGRLLAAFLENQSSITAPTSTIDRTRIDAMNMLNADAARTGPSAGSGTALQGGGHADALAGSSARFCAACGTQSLAPSAAFCAACGARLA